MSGGKGESEDLDFTCGLRVKGKRRRESLAQLARVSGNRTTRNDILPSLALEMIPLDDLRMPTRKVRLADLAHVREVANAIRAFGFCQPMLVSKNGLVLDGEIRFRAARQIGLAKIPCIRIHHLTDDEQRALRLAANRLGEKGKWDLPALKLEFEDLILLDAPIEITGFSPAEIDHIVLGDEITATEIGPLEPLEDVAATARPGDVFQLGPHRILCGDAREPETYQRLMQDTPQARLVLTDEPYNVPIAGHVTSGYHRQFAMASGEMSKAEFLDFNLAWMRSTLDNLCDGGLLATFIDWRGLPTVNAAAEKVGLDPLNLIVWAKTNGGMGSLYRSQHELLPIFKKGLSPHLNNIELGKKGGRWRSNLWTYPGASSIGSGARQGLKDHPTVKPTAMLADALLDLTNRGETVIDPFLGSGSTLIACDETGRVCRGTEIDPIYIDTIIRRFEAQTGKSAVHVTTGETFEAISRTRRRDSE